MLQALTNALVFDVDAGELTPGGVVIDGERIVEVIAEGEGPPAAAAVTDLRGAALLPGLIDAHVHVYAFTADWSFLARQAPSYAAAQASRLMGEMLDRGFTTVRDVGGADFGLAQAQAEGLIRGPRLVFGGKALSPTGGHADTRGPGVHGLEPYWQPTLGRIADGVDAVRAAARDEIRKGAHHVKIMANGGISSPTDRISSDQYAEAEIAAIVDEAAMARLYVVAHTYTASSIARCVRNGVRSIEHGNLVDAATIDLMAAHDCFLVPTLVTFHALKKEGVRYGLPADLEPKIDEVLAGGLGAIEMARRAGVPMAYGTDLIGGMQARQLEEFAIRREVVPAAELLRSATWEGAKLLRREHELGRIAPGYLADLVAVDGDPLRDVTILTRPERHLKLVVQGGTHHTPYA